MRCLRQTDYLRTPWKNGGGETLLVAVAPAGASIGDFDFRISISAVVEDGAFSSFTGIDRTLCLLAGASIDLVIDGAYESIAAPHGIHGFRGEAQCFARLPTGPIVDLNVMSRRTAFNHRVVAAGQGTQLRGGDGGGWFVSIEHSVATSGQQSVALLGQDALRLDPGEAVDLSAGLGWLIDFSPV